MAIDFILTNATYIGIGLALLWAILVIYFAHVSLKRGKK